MSKKSPKGFAGIHNQGATCYLNTLLQTLYMSPEVKDAINRLNEKPIQSKKNLNKNISIDHQLKELFEKLDAKETGNTHGITRNLGIKVYKQQDVAEYFRKIVNKLAEESDGETCNISQIYQSKVINSLTCLECNVEAPEECCLLDIPLPIHLNDCGSRIESVNAALQDFLKVVTLDGDNLCYCETCHKKTKTEMRYYFERLPQILVLQLKRFEFDYSMMTLKKLHNKVEIPLSLKFQKQDKNNGKTEWCLNSMDSKDSVIAQGNEESSSLGSVLPASPGGKDLDDVQKAERAESHQDSKDTGKAQGNQESSSLGSELPASSGGEDLDEVQKAERAESHQIYSTYNLFAICDHSGEFGFGHYVAYIRPDSSSKWYCFNDTCVTEKEDFFPEAYQGNTVSTPCIRSSTAYLLMYRKEKENSNQEHVRGINVDEKVERIKTRGICDGGNNGEQIFEPYNPSLENPPCKNQAQAKNRDETMEKTECRNQSETSIENGEEPVVGDKSDEDRKEARAKETKVSAGKKTVKKRNLNKPTQTKLEGKGKGPLLKHRKEKWQNLRKQKINLKSCLQRTIKWQKKVRSNTLINSQLSVEIIKIVYENLNIAVN
ncbi:ubiquitin carboxyl-terminal hydrolase 47-like isoform X7 [Pristis pectinata]|uniref:ubiquitin carboxyl-terminal hydrolase 47-like isoform X7 n=1 Tax=Pristis pectinata TaxID=685728 RepID=UPI00223D783D|nr:ubiquitin carboxyl-terminal hydrolase 47-like isoform X7 [Pristis pectinata]